MLAFCSEKKLCKWIYEMDSYKQNFQSLKSDWIHCTWQISACKPLYDQHISEHNIWNRACAAQEFLFMSFAFEAPSGHLHWWHSVQSKNNNNKPLCKSFWHWLNMSSQMRPLGLKTQTNKTFAMNLHLLVLCVVWNRDGKKNLPEDIQFQYKYRCNSDGYILD